MLKLEIALDEQKIIQVGEYTVDSIYSCLDKIFTENRLKKYEVVGTSHFYCDTGKKSDLADMFRCIFYLETQKWFMDYVTTWLLYDSYATNKENEFEIEDILAQSIRRNRYVKN
jgi:hypothetical protein